MMGLDNEFKVWEGVYSAFEDASRHASGDGFSSDLWVERSHKRLVELLGNPQEELLVTPAYLLPVVTAMTSVPGRTLRVLDFGGGAGSGFLSLAAAPGMNSDFEYHIVDNAAVVDLGRQHFGDDQRLVFHAALPQPFPIDILHFGSCVQYIADLEGLLNELAAFEPAVILFSDVFAGDIRDFWTLQNLWGSRIPFHFMSGAEFVHMVEARGFRLLLQVPYAARILGKMGPLPMENFPSEWRLSRASHYLFKSI